MTYEEYLTACIYLLSALTTPTALELAEDAGITEECFHDGAMQRAFAYAAKRLRKGKPISPAELAELAGMELAVGRVDISLYAPAIVNYHLAAEFRRHISSALDSLDDDAATAVRRTRESLLRLSLPRIAALDEEIGPVAGTKPAAVSWIVPDLLPERWPTIVYGRGGTAKSYLATLLAMCVASGEEFLGEFATTRTNVLYADWEMSREEFLRRTHELATGSGLGHLVDEAGLLRVDGLYYMRPVRPLADLLPDIHEMVREMGVGLLVVDSYGFAVLQAGSDARDPAKDALTSFTQLQQLPCTVLIIDHMPHKGKHAYGSVYKTNAARYVWRVESWQTGADTTYQSLHLDKHNVGRNLPDIYLRVRWTPQMGTRDYSVQVTVVDEEEALGAKGEYRQHLESWEIGTRGLIMSLLELGPQSVDDLARGIGVSPRAVIEATKYLVESRRIEQAITHERRRGKPTAIYRLPSAVDLSPVEENEL